MEIVLLLSVRVRLSQSEAAGLAACAEPAGHWRALQQRCCSNREPLATGKITMALNKAICSCTNRDGTEAMGQKEFSLSVLKTGLVSF